METPVAQTEDATSFEREVVPGEPRALAERRSHAWKQRERMAWVATITIAITMIVPLGHDVTAGSSGIISNGQWAFAVVLLVFVGGKAAVEALVSIRGIK
ncbi:MAG: hypothetical protein HY749_16165 [Gammaproteobacteria bacterium]|nr:hypothetical protein [Gammaproteobacteria bacterium]